MSALIQRLLLLMSVLAAFFWLELPLLRPYSLQAFLAMTVLYFVVKRFNNRQAKIWHVAPSTLSVEMPIVTFSLLLLIGATGNLDSIFYPLSFLHLFFLVFSTTSLTAIVTTFLIMLFHYGLMPEMNQADYSHLVTLPLMLFLFLFAKDQYQQAVTGKLIQDQDENSLSQAHQVQAYIEEFLSAQVLPRLQTMRHLLEYPAQNQHPLQQHLTILQIDTQRALQRIMSQPVKTRTEVPSSTSGSTATPNSPTAADTLAHSKQTEVSSPPVTSVEVTITTESA